MQEKRTQPRIVVGLPAFIELGAGANSRIKVLAIDLGIAGMSVCCPVALAQGAHCRVEMRIPGETGRLIRVNCELIYSVLSQLSCEFRLGLRFVEFHDDDQAVLQQYLDWRAGGSTAPAPAAKAG